MRIWGTLVVLALGAVVLATTPPAIAVDSPLARRGVLSVTYGAVYGHATNEAFSSAAVGDVTGDGVADIVAGGLDGHLRGWTTAGNRFLDRTLPGAGAIHASPTLVDVTGDGVLDVLAANDAGYVEIIAVAGGTRVVFRQRDCTAPMSAGRPCGVFGTPLVADIDRDGRPEVVASSYDHHVYAWNLDGSHVPGFPRFLLDTLWSSPTVLDLDGDGWLEIVVGGDMDANYPGQPYPAGGLLWVLRHDGVNQPGFPRSLPGQTIWSSPAVVDISGDGLRDIVVGTGLQFGAPAGARVWAIDRAGRDLAGWPAATRGRVMGSPAVGDVTGDGRPEVAVVSEGGWLSVFRPGGTLLWEACNRNDRRACDGQAPIHGAPAIADVDGDGMQEVIAASEQFLRIFDGPTGQVEAQDDLGRDMFAPAATPTVAVLGGETRIVLNTVRNTNNDGARAAGDTQSVYVHGTGVRLRADAWPTFKQNAQRIAAPVKPVATDACPRAEVEEDGFVDVLAIDVHEPSVDCAWWLEIAAGTGPGVYRPAQRVTRGQMATFLVRAIESTGTMLPSPLLDPYSDDDGNPHEENIEKLSEAGIAQGYGNRMFRPDDPVLRGQMATFLVRSAEYVLERELATGSDRFSDDNGHPHEANINKAANNGIASGVGGTRFAPNRAVARSPMATFLVRMLGLVS